MKESLTKTVGLLLVLCGAFVFASCASVPSEVPEDLSPDEIINDAIGYAEKENYEAAKFYYNALLDRYGTDSTYRVIGEYEIGHILLKQRKYDEAAVYLQDVISTIYGDYYGSIPAKYLVLAQNDLKRAQNNGATPKEEDEDEDW